MPARDPAASPAHPTSIAAAAGTSPSLPAHQPHGHPFLSPASSAFSTGTTSGLEYGSLTDNPRMPIRENGFVSPLLRRVSGEHGGSNMHSSTGQEGSAEENGHGNGGTRSRKQSQDSGDDSGPNVNLATTSQAIRESSNRLASLSFTSRPRTVSHSFGGSSDASSFVHAGLSPLSGRHSVPIPPVQGSAADHKPSHPSHLNPAVSGVILEEVSPPKSSIPDSASNVGRSGLSMMMEREGEKLRHRVPTQTEESPESSPPEEMDKTPMPRRIALESVTSEVDLTGESTPTARPRSLAENQSEGSEGNDLSALRRFLAAEVERVDVESGYETTPLLGGRNRRWSEWLQQDLWSVGQRASKITARDVVRGCIEEPIKTLPAVILGLLLNVLDGVSYGMILFPANAAFVDFGSLGVSMFFMSCIVSQLVFSLGGSIFPGGNGSMMIEAVPFFHLLVNIIENEIGDDVNAIVATTMVSFAFSSILTGLVFFALGAFKLGSLIGYFPRHILVGCIGGVGIFLIETGLEVSRGLKEEGFEYNLATLKLFFQSTHAVILWTLPLVLAVLLRVITHFYHHQLIFPAYFFIIPIVFYITVAIGGWSFDDLRDQGWVFDVGKNTQAWWKFYTLFDFRKTDWMAFWAAMPTQCALVFFGILHVPLNVPALGVSLAEDNVKLDRELVAHGFSNLASGLTGTVPNYLTYVNTVLFYRCGGGSRLSGVMLALATGAIMFVGPTIIGFLPVTLVGALIFVLGLDLAIEAVWDTRNRVNKMEYVTIWAIAIGMTVWDFVIGLLFGIILACIFFVVQNSRRRAIRAVFNGATAKSTVRRPRSQRAFIQQVGSQTYVMKLQGFLFFGTISVVEEEIRKLLDLAIWQHNPIRFLIIDFTLVHGLDFSSAEAFVRVQRLLAAKDVLLIMCGAAPNGLVGTALQSVDLWADREGVRVEVFDGLNDALEWTENAYLTAFYENQKAKEVESAKRIDFPKVPKPPFSLAESFENSPRRSHLAKAGGDTLPRTYAEAAAPEPSEAEIRQPLPLLVQTLGAYSDELSPAFFSELVPYFTQVPISAGQTLWRQGDHADGLYLIEVGSLRATYSFDDHRRLVQETMVAGTVAGDLSTLSDTQRNATVVAERDGVLWKLEMDALGKLGREKPEVARDFIHIVLKVVAEEQEVLSSHLVAVLS